ncbi:dipeptidase [Sesbania bispinosa]|nr:dipeptidase [Sesbania bispinosa]
MGQLDSSRQKHGGVPATNRLQLSPRHGGVPAHKSTATPRWRRGFCSCAQICGARSVHDKEGCGPCASEIEGEERPRGTEFTMRVLRHGDAMSDIVVSSRGGRGAPFV